MEGITLTLIAVVVLAVVFDYITRILAKHS